MGMTKTKQNNKDEYWISHDFYTVVIYAAPKIYGLLIHGQHAFSLSPRGLYYISALKLSILGCKPGKFLYYH